VWSLFGMTFSKDRAFFPDVFPLATSPELLARS
jgi:hypothetical protein